MTACIEPQLHFSFYLKQKLLVVLILLGLVPAAAKALALIGSLAGGNFHTLSLPSSSHLPRCCRLMNNPGEGPRPSRLFFVRWSRLSADDRLVFQTFSALC